MTIAFFVVDRAKAAGENGPQTLERASLAAIFYDSNFLNHTGKNSVCQRAFESG
jgi:hypothetical protein